MSALEAVLRLALLPSAVWTLWMTWRGPLAMWRGSMSISDKANSGAFFFGLSTTVGQVFYLFLDVTPFIVFALLCALVAHGLMIRVRFLARRYGPGDIEWLLSHPDMLLPLRELHAIKPHLAATHVRMMRQTLAREMAGG